MTERRSSMAKPGKQKDISFKEWLEHPERYVRRGEVVQVVDKLLRLDELKRKRDRRWWSNWWRAFWGIK